MSDLYCTTRGELVRQFGEIARTGADCLLRAEPPQDTASEFARSVVDGLESAERSVDCRYLYDARGSGLYEEITRQPEYYPTRTEAAILRQHASDIRRQAGPVKLLELGSGSSIKTDRLLDVWVAANGSRTTYIPVDVSSSALVGATERIRQRLPSVQVIGIHGTYDDGLALLGAVGPVMGMFLGSTLGNFGAGAAQALLDTVAGHLPAGAWFLLGVDLVKDRGVLEGSTAS